MDETDGLRDTGEREAAAGSIDEGYGEVSEFIDKSSIDLTRDRTCSNARKSCQVCFCPRRSFRADAGCLLSNEAPPGSGSGRCRSVSWVYSAPDDPRGRKIRGWACSADGKHSMAKARVAQPLFFGKRRVLLSRCVPASGRNLRPSTGTPTTAFQPQQQQHLAQQLSTPKSPHPPTLYGFLCAYDGRVCLPVSQG